MVLGPNDPLVPFQKPKWNAIDWGGEAFIEFDGADSTPIFHFLVLRKLGQGGMGATYLGWSAARLCVLKIPLPTSGNVGPDARALEQFEREMDAIEKVSHPSVTTFLDRVQLKSQQSPIPNSPGYLMKYVPAGTLRDFQHDQSTPTGSLRRFSLGEALRIFRDLIDALQAIHSVGLAHGDIKPGNILLELDQRIRLCDFGLARPLPTGLGTAADPGGGTWGYFPSELLMTHGLQEILGADFFAAGCVLAELLSGLPAYTRDDILNSAIQPGFPTHAQGLPEIRQAYGDEIAGFVDSLTCLDPQRRLYNLAGIQQELRRFAAVAPRGTDLVNRYGPTFVQSLVGDEAALAWNRGSPLVPGNLAAMLGVVSHRGALLDLAESLLETLHELWQRLMGFFTHMSSAESPLQRERFRTETISNLYDLAQFFGQLPRRRAWRILERVPTIQPLLETIKDELVQVEHRLGRFQYLLTRTSSESATFLSQRVLIELMNTERELVSVWRQSYDIWLKVVLEIKTCAHLIQDLQLPMFSSP